MKSLAVSYILAVIGLSLSSAAGWAAGTVQISDAWTRATPGQSTRCAVYLTIVSTEADAVVAATTPIAASASLHVHRMANGVAEMRSVDRAELAAAIPFHFAPMGYHIMLIGLTAPLKAGEHFPLTLKLEKAGAVTATVTVRSLRDTVPGAPMAAMPNMGSMPGMTHMDMSDPAK